MNRIALFGMIAVLSAGCATMSNRTKSILTMLAVGSASATVGAVTAPKDEKPIGHAALWGGIGAATAGVASLYIFDEQARSEELQRKLEVSEKELAALRDEGSPEPKLIHETTAPFGRDPPPEVKMLVKPGKWSVYKLNRWVSEGENTLIHQDRMVRLVPPVLSPANEANEGEKQ